MVLGSIVDFCCCCLVTKLHLTLCDPTDYSLPESSVHEISQARILECIALSFSRGSPQPRIQTRISWLAGGFFTTEPLGKPTVDLQCVSFRCTAVFQSYIHLYLSFQSFPLSLHFSSVAQFSSVQFSRSVVSDSLGPPGLQHARPPCPSPTRI